MRSARLSAVLIFAALLLGAPAAHAQTTDAAAVERGAYLFDAADCAACHTDRKNKGAPLAGGVALNTPFGTFFGPNISPDPQHGIGNWSAADFHRALREGKGRGGEYLFPVFPYPAFSGLSDQDIADLYAYVIAQPPQAQPDKPHQVKFPFRFRFGLVFWRMLFFAEGPLAPVPGQSAEWNRGRYLVEAVAHCEECHTPRNFLGGLETSRPFAGNPQGPDNQKAPNITPDPDTGIGKWSADDIAALLKSGQTPEFDFVGGGMAQVVSGTAKLTDEDRHAMAVFLKSVPPLRATGK